MVSFGRKSTTVEPPEAADGVELAPPVMAPPMTQQSPVAAFPRVNLIPEIIVTEVRVRRAKMVLAGAVVTSLALAGVGYFAASGQVSAAQDKLDTETARSASLAAEATKYADVPKVQSDLLGAQTQQAAAMAGEVRWSFILNDLALTMPAGVSLTSLKATITGATGAAAPGSAAAASGQGGGVTSVLGNPGIGTLTFEAQALDNNRVATFLDSITKTNGFIDPFATQSAANDSGTDTSTTAATAAPKSVIFSASATISNKLLSHRYDLKGN